MNDFDRFDVALVASMAVFVTVALRLIVSIARVVIALADPEDDCEE